MNRKPFNVTLIHPGAYIHSLALKEAADYVHATLVACGYPSARTTNHLASNAHNIIFCAHLLGPGDIVKIPSDSIIFNSEQLEDTAGWHLQGGAYFETLGRFFVWDYSARNLDKIVHPRKRLIPFRYCNQLLRPQLRREPGPSLLFYGAVTPRRRRILEKLHSSGVPVEVLFGEYGGERDEKLRRSWAVLNLHKSDDTSAFEPIRCFYPLINAVPIISEETEDAAAQDFRGAVFFFDQASLVDGVKSLRADARAYDERSRDMLENFKRTSALPEVAAAAEHFYQSLSRNAESP
ncbi:MAG TPA: hypothetical protein VGI51_09340 [Steroidobacteraceae bacterium]|jgi:hypothetical protein